MIQIDQNTYAQAPLIADEGIQYGRAVFETMPVYRRPVLWSAHILRLNRGLAALNICQPPDSAWLYSQFGQLKLENCVLKLIVSPSNLIFQIRPLPLHQNKVKLTLQPDWRSRHPLLLQHKTVQYMAGLLAWETARQDGYDDALLINPAGQIAECSRSNIFFYRYGQIHTPDLSCGLLPGIMRQWLMDELDVICGHYHADDLYQADAVWICNSVTGFRPVEAIDSQIIAQNQITDQLQQTFAEKVADLAK